MGAFATPSLVVGVRVVPQIVAGRGAGGALRALVVAAGARSPWLVEQRFVLVIAGTDVALEKRHRQLAAVRIVRAPGGLDQLPQRVVGLVGHHAGGLERLRDRGQPELELLAIEHALRVAGDRDGELAERRRIALLPRLHHVTALLEQPAPADARRRAVDLDAPGVAVDVAEVERRAGGGG